MKIFDRKTQKKKNEQGFTLVELAIVMLIAGILITPLIGLYSNYLTEQKREATKAAIETARSSLLSYYASYGSYPCPADLSKGIMDANYGMDSCGTDDFATIAGKIPLDTCISGGGLCRVSGSKDADGDGKKDPILIGAIPFMSLKKGNRSTLEVSDVAIDGWDGVLLYAVSQNLTESAYPTLDRLHEGFTNDYKYGVVTAKDEFGNDTAGTNGDANFAIISSGPNQIGAWNINGTQKSPCNTTTREGENCDADGTFMSSISSYDANNLNKFDDITSFTKIPSGLLWAYIINTETGETTGSTKNLNKGNVGVGTTSPQALLDVKGNLKTPSVMANVICKPIAGGGSVEYCMPMNFLWNANYSSPTNVVTPSGSQTFQNRCPNSTDAISAIKEGKVQCTAVKVPPKPIAPLECDPGYYMNGISTGGCIYCSGGTSPKC